jgi:hypothetical protein
MELCTATPLIACKDKGDCPPTQSCSETRQLCIPTSCSLNSDCAQGQKCDPRMRYCFMACKNNSDCQTSMICDFRLGACVTQP